MPRAISSTGTRFSNWSAWSDSRRDQREWGKLADCYVEDLQVCTTWFLGTGREFAAASQEMFEKRGRAAST